MHKMLCTAAASALLLVAGSAQAGLVTNGGFEDGYFTGWTMFDAGVAKDFEGNQHSGNSAAVFLHRDGAGIYQTLQTVAGQRYTVSFWLKAYSTGAGDAFSFNWDGGDAELSLVDPAPADYQQFNYTLTASSASTDLRFTGRNVGGAVFLDDVAVALAGPALGTAVPEPMSLALVAVALAGAAAVSRRQRA